MIMRRRPAAPAPARTSLLGTMARTAVVVGTANAVTNKMNGPAQAAQPAAPPGTRGSSTRRPGSARRHDTGKNGIAQGPGRPEGARHPVGRRICGRKGQAAGLMRIGADCLATKEKGRSLEVSERPWTLWWWSWRDSGEFPIKSDKVLINQGLGRNTTKLHYVRYTEGG